MGTLVALMILFSGFFIHIESLPIWIKWMSYVSTIRWSFMAFVLYEFEGQTGYECNELQSKYQCITNGEQVLQRLGFDEYTKEFSVAMIAVLLGSFHILAFVMLKVNRIRYLDVPKESDKQSVELQKM